LLDFYSSSRQLSSITTAWSTAASLYPRRPSLVFLYAFGKSGRENIDDDELVRWRIAGRVVLEGDIHLHRGCIADGQLREV
jgi:hypothetical protein